MDSSQTGTTKQWSSSEPKLFNLVCCGPDPSVLDQFQLQTVDQVQFDSSSCYTFWTTFVYEEYMTSTWDIIAERLWFVLVFGDLVWIPFTFSIQGWFTTAAIIANCLVFVLRYPCL